MFDILIIIIIIKFTSQSRETKRKKIIYCL